MTAERKLPDFDLTGKIVLVTGAGRGMGSHIAVALAHYGADVAICSRTREELDTISDRIKKYGRSVFVEAIDLTKVDAIESMVGRIEDQLGPIDILVNNAGMNIPQWAEEVTEDSWDKVFDINIKAQFFCA